MLGRRKKKRRVSLKTWLKELIRQHHFLLGIIVAAALLRFIDLGRQGLWVDEMCVYNDSKSTYKRIFYSVHPVTFLLARTALYLKDNEYFLRLPSAISGLLGVFLIYLLGKELFSRRAGIIAAILLTFSPYHIYYSQDANYYGEMMFFTMLTMWLLFLLFRTRKIYLLPLFFVSLYLTYKTHLFSLFVVASSLATLVLWLLTDKELHHFLRREIKSLNQKSHLIFPAALIVFFIVISPILWYFFRLLIHYSFHFPTEGMRAENFEPSFGFFLKLATDYGIAFQDYILRNYLFTSVFVLLFLFGLIAIFKVNKIASLFFLMLTVSPFFALSFWKAEHFYHPRYTSFIVPIYLLCAGQGIAIIGNWLTERIKLVKEKLSLQKILTWGLSLIIILMMLPNLIRYFTGEKQNWKGAVKYLRENLKAEDKVLAYLYWNRESLAFYFRHFGMDISKIVKIPEVRGAGAITGLEFLKEFCYKAKGDVYLASSYTRYEPAVIFDWVSRYFNKVLYLPSLHPQEINREGKEVILYKFNYKDAYIFPPQIYQRKITPGSSERLFSQRTLFDRTGDYRFRLLFEDKITTPSEIDLTIDGQKIGEFEKTEERQTLLTARVSEGTHLIEISRAKVNSSKVKELQIYYWTGGKVFVEAELPDFMHPTSSKWVRTDFGAQCFTLKINAYLGYNHIFSEKDQDYFFRLRALNDEPGPVLLEVSLDEKPAGILSFDKSDNTWSIKGFPLHLSAGEHTIRLHFLNNFPYAGSKNPDEDNDALLDYFELIPLPQYDGEEKDERLKVESKELAQIPEVLLNYADREDALKLSPEWQFTSADASYSLEKTADRKAVKISLPPLSKGATIVSLPFSVPPGEFLYFSTDMRTQGLNNHSANVRVNYLDANKQIIGSKWLCDEGLTGDIDEWIRYVFFESVPQGTASATIQLFVYPNSKQFARHSGTAWFSTIRAEQIEK